MTPAQIANRHHRARLQAAARECRAIAAVERDDGRQYPAGVGCRRLGLRLCRRVRGCPCQQRPVTRTSEPSPATRAQTPAGATRVEQDDLAGPHLCLLPGGADLGGASARLTTPPPIGSSGHSAVFPITQRCAIAALPHADACLSGGANRVPSAQQSASGACTASCRFSEES